MIKNMIMSKMVSFDCKKTDAIFPANPLSMSIYFMLSLAPLYNLLSALIIYVSPEERPDNTSTLSPSDFPSFSHLRIAVFEALTVYIPCKSPFVMMTSFGIKTWELN